MSGLLDSLIPAMDSILSVRDSIGAVIDPVFFVTRTWSGTCIGDGIATDVLVQLLPSPCIKSYAQDVRIREGGNLKAGDIILKEVSRTKYTEADLDSITSSSNIEKLYLVGSKLYQVVSIVKGYVTWDIHLRELSNQARY